MDKETNKPKAGLWDKLPTEDIERKPKITFEVNITQKVALMKHLKHM